MTKWLFGLLAVSTAMLCFGSSMARAAGAPPNPCHYLAPHDMDGMLEGATLAPGPLPGDPQSCKYTNAAGSSVTVSIRPGLGNETLKEWASGTPVPATPVSGIGDRAMWQSSLHEMIATKNNLLCDIEAGGMNAKYRADEPGLQKRLGALCTKVFATH